MVSGDRPKGADAYGETTPRGQLTDPTSAMVSVWQGQPKAIDTP
jgi:hypothetical protein